MADYTERIETKPLSQAEFERLVVSRFEEHDFLHNNRFEVMYVPKREDNVRYVEAVVMIDDENSYWVEIGVDPGVKRKRKRYSRDYVPKEEAIRIFKSVLVDYEMPDIKDWDDFTDEQEYYLHADRIISRFPFIENPTEDDEFAYVEALDFMIDEIQENEIENIKKLAWFYGERHLFDLERKYLEMAYDIGDTDAACELGYMWYYGQHGEIDYEKAYHYFKEGLKGDGANVYYCRYKLADMYRFGKCVDQDTERYRDAIKQALEDMGEEPPDLSYPYPELAYRMAGIRADEGNTTEAIYLLKKARHFLAERLVRDNYWGSISTMKRIVKKMHELTPDFDHIKNIYDIFRLEGDPCSLTFAYDGTDHEIEIGDDGGIALDGKWYRSMEAFFEKCSVGEHKLTSIYYELYGLALA